MIWKSKEEYKGEFKGKERKGEIIYYNLQIKEKLLEISNNWLISLPASDTRSLTTDYCNNRKNKKQKTIPNRLSMFLSALNIPGDVLCAAVRETLPSAALYVSV